jgi:hypothetical protein
MAVAPQRHQPTGRGRNGKRHCKIGPERCRNAARDLAPACGAHRHVKGQHQHVNSGFMGAAHQIEADSVSVAGKAIELEPQDVGRDLRRSFNGHAANGAERVGNPRPLRSFREIALAPGHTIAGPPMGAMPIGAA